MSFLPVAVYEMPDRCFKCRKCSQAREGNEETCSPYTLKCSLQNLFTIHANLQIQNKYPVSVCFSDCCHPNLNSLKKLFSLFVFYQIKMVLNTL